MITKIAIGVLTGVAVFLGYVALQSPEYEVSREITIRAPAEKIFPYLNSSKMAHEWGPWVEIDPDAKMSYAGPDVGVGSLASWEGGKQLGTGSATIVESAPNERVRIKLEYVKPMNMVQDSWYLLRPTEAGTIVTWKVQGKNTFLGRVMCAFMNMDKMVGGMFEKGLLKLKTLAEKQ